MTSASDEVMTGAIVRESVAAGVLIVNVPKPALPLPFWIVPVEPPAKLITDVPVAVVVPPNPNDPHEPPKPSLQLMIMVPLFRVRLLKTVT